MTKDNLEKSLFVCLFFIWSRELESIMVGQRQWISIMAWLGVGQNAESSQLELQIQSREKTKEMKWHDHLFKLQKPICSDVLYPTSPSKQHYQQSTTIKHLSLWGILTQITTIPLKKMSLSPQQPLTACRYIRSGQDLACRLAPLHEGMMERSSPMYFLWKSS